MSVQLLLDRLRRDEHDWRLKRWHHVAMGVMAVTSNGYVLFRWNQLMDAAAGSFDGSTLREATTTIYAMGMASVLFGAFLVYGVSQLAITCRHWNGDPTRQGVIACLEAQTQSASSSRR
jgi:hypothetical protein